MQVRSIASEAARIAQRVRIKNASHQPDRDLYTNSSSNEVAL